jgi:predicted DNA-binding protein
VSLELRDLRLKITPETHCWLEAESRTTGKDKPQIVRELLHQYVLEKLNQSDIFNSLLVAEGLKRQ